MSGGPDEATPGGRHPRRRGVRGGQSLPVARAPGNPVNWCSTWANSPRATISRGSTIRVPTRRYPLQMWLCSSCGLAQLVGETHRGRGASRHRARSTRRTGGRCGRAACGRRGGFRAGTGSPSSPVPMGVRGWDLLAERGMTPVTDGGPADVVIDSFGMMHATDQAAALAERIARVAPGGVLVLQYHSLDTIVRLGQWNALRHGHFAYYSTSALVGMLEANGFRPSGGVALRPLRWHRSAGGRPQGRWTGGPPTARCMRSCRRTPAWEFVIPRPSGAAGSRRSPRFADYATGSTLQRTAGRCVVGYGAASRAVALLCGAPRWTGDSSRQIVDTSTAKARAAHARNGHSHRRPGHAGNALGRRDVLLFVPDLLTEVRGTFPEVEAGGADGWMRKRFACENGGGDVSAPGTLPRTTG